jgi:hypothetical protein
MAEVLKYSPLDRLERTLLFPKTGLSSFSQMMKIFLSGPLKNPLTLLAQVLSTTHCFPAYRLPAMLRPTGALLSCMFGLCSPR